MGVVEDLARARADFERGEWASALDVWSGTQPDDLSPADLMSAGAAAQLLGRRDEAVRLYERAHQASLDSGDSAAAVRCAFHLTMVLATSGEPSRAAGWLAMAERVLATITDDVIERGYVVFGMMYRHFATGDVETAARFAAEATAIGRRHSDPELVAIGLCAQGRMAIFTGRVAEGLGLLDESMAGLTASTVSPTTLGFVYCTAIEGCQEISDVGRVAEWTARLHDWCSSHPGLVAFTGQCSLHRGQILAAHGAFREAKHEFDRAIERYRRGGQLDAVGWAAYERGEALRILGDLSDAESSYQTAAEHGFDPQPGLSLLWAARGQLPAATAAIRRLLAEAAGPVQRVRALPGIVGVLLACDDLPQARGCSQELDTLAKQFSLEALLGQAALAAAAIELADDDPAGALPYARKARALFARLDNPYAGGLATALIGRALLGLGDQESARGELNRARTMLAPLGARPDVDGIDRLLAPTARPRGLTEREIEVLRLVAAGRSNAQIAADLVLSERTVARHLSNIFTKLEISSRTAAAAFAFDHGLV